MTRLWRTALSILAVVSALGCRRDGPDVSALLANAHVVARSARFDAALADTSSSAANDAPLARWLLPPFLNEISGLAITADGRLLAHGDEGGQVSEIDYRSGILVKYFIVGRESAEVDFEGITVASDAIYMVVSNGDVYEFREGAHGERVKYAVHKTGLSELCEFEGIAYDAQSSSLLLACKNIRAKELRGSIVIVRWSLEAGAGGTNGNSRLIVPFTAIAAAIDSKSFTPSDITVDASSGNYLLIAGREKAFVEVTPLGEVVHAGPIPGDHEQAEGVAITKDSILIIADEAVTSRGVITLYRRR